MNISKPDKIALSVANKPKPKPRLFGNEQSENQLKLN